MVLPQGITGFAEGGRGVAAPTVDFRSFARACHMAARAGSGRVERVEAASYPRNYHRAILRLGAAPVAVLCNAHHPWIAFAEASENLPLRFTDAVALAARFSDEFPCEVLDFTTLETHPDEAVLAGLGDAERKQVGYWRPRRIGDIIFNSWD